MAPKSKVAELEAKLSSKESELQAAQAAFTKAEASRAKLKQYLEAFREQAVNTTQVITQFQQLQTEHSALQQAHQQLQSELRDLRQQHQRASEDNERLRREAAAQAALRQAQQDRNHQQEKERQEREKERLRQQCAELQREQQRTREELQRLRSETQRLVQENKRLLLEQREQQQRRQQQQVEEEEGKQRPEVRQTKQEQEEGVQGTGVAVAVVADGADDDTHHQQQQLLQLQRTIEELQAQLSLAQQQQRQQQQPQLEVPLQGLQQQQGLEQLQQEQEQQGRDQELQQGQRQAPGPQPATRTAPVLATAATAAGEAAVVRRPGGADSAPQSAAASATLGVGNGDGEDYDSDGGGGGQGGEGRDTQQRAEKARVAAFERSKHTGAQEQDGGRERGRRRKEEEQWRREQQQREQEARRLVKDLESAEGRRQVAEAALEAARRELAALRRREAEQREEMEELRALLQALQAQVLQHSVALDRHDETLNRHNSQLTQQAAAVQHQTTQIEQLAAARADDRARGAQALAGLERRLGARVGAVEAGGAELRARLNGVTTQLAGVFRTHSILRAAFGGDGGGGGGEWDRVPEAAADLELGPSLAPLAAPHPGGQGGQRADVAAAAGAGRAAPRLVELGGREEEEEEEAAALSHRDKRRRLVGPDGAGPGAGDGELEEPMGAWDADMPSQQEPQQQHLGPQALPPPQEAGLVPYPPTQAPAPSPATRRGAGYNPFALPPSASDHPQHASTAAVVEAPAAEPLRRRGVGRPRKERSPGEFLATLLDGKATAPSLLAKIASAAARRAAEAVRNGVVHPEPLAAAVCSAVLRCCKARVGVAAIAAADADTELRNCSGVGQTMGSAGAAAAGVEELQQEPKPAAAAASGIATARGAAGSSKKSTTGTGGGGSDFLSLLLPPGRGSGGRSGGATLADALSSLWCKPPELQRQVPKWLLQIVREADMLLGGPYGGPAAAAGAAPAAVAATEHGGGSGAGTGLDAGPQVTSGGQTDGEGIRSAAGRRLTGQGGTGGGGGGGCRLLGGLLVRQLNAVACYPLGGAAEAEADEVEAGGRGEGEGAVEAAGSASGAAQGALPPSPLAAPRRMRTRAKVLPASLGEQCAAAAALGQLLRLYRDREGFQGTALDLLHAAAEARRQAHQGPPQRQLQQAATTSPHHSLHRPRVPSTASSPAVAAATAATGTAASAAQLPVQQTQQHTLACVSSATGGSLIPLSCLLVGWPAAALPTPTAAVGTATAAAAPGAAATTGPLDRRDSAALLATTAVDATTAAETAGSAAAAAVAAAGGDASLYGTGTEALAARKEEAAAAEGHPAAGAGAVGPGFLPGGDGIRSGDSGSSWSWLQEAQLVTQPLQVAMLIAVQLLALEQLAAAASSCCPEVTAGPHAPSFPAPLAPPLAAKEAAAAAPAAPSTAGVLQLLAGLDVHAEAVAAAGLLRALAEHSGALGGGQGKAAAAVRPPQPPPPHLLPGVLEVLAATGAVRCKPVAEAAGTALADGKAEDAAGRAGQGERGLVGCGPLDALLASALQQARSALSELAARLMGLMLVAVTEQSRHEHGGVAAAAVDAGAGAAGQGRPSSDPRVTVAYIDSLRQALLLTCHFLPYGEVYDRVLREAVAVIGVLIAGGSTAAGGGQGRSGTASAEAVAAALLGAEGLPTGTVAPLGDAAASAAGSPVGQGSAFAGPAAAPPLAPSHALPAVPSPGGGSRDPATDLPATEPQPNGLEAGTAAGTNSMASTITAVRLLLELIHDVACQALGSTAAAPAGEPPGLGGGLAAPAEAAALRLGCAGLCESLSGLLPALLWLKEERAGPAATETPLQPPQGDVDGLPAVSSLGGADCGRGDGGDGEGLCRRRLEALAARVVVTAVQVSSMCLAGAEAAVGECLDGSAAGVTEVVETLATQQLQECVLRVLQGVYSWLTHGSLGVEGTVVEALPAARVAEEGAGGRDAGRAAVVRLLPADVWELLSSLGLPAGGAGEGVQQAAVAEGWREVVTGEPQPVGMEE
ncbi:hypothetical protein Agub_g2548 [Astrephomene gubernaculifera]|uniref:Uncharacterized protein n=1 Tax=Astrephomene gubernaculifera TaxID=47775 RepID=A0AAD3DH83_9CHLO|nr:hypothetical protein Agub_g2548 [Astrephomene gubernaculifera]